MKTLVILLGLTALAHADPARWDAFPGPDSVPAVSTGDALVVVPLSSGTWEGARVSFVLASVVEARAHALIVEGPSQRFEVPGAFVGPRLAPSKLAVGAYVLFPRDAMTPLVLARVTKASKAGYTIAYDAGDTIENVEDVPAAHVIPIDGKLHFGVPVSYELHGRHVPGSYVGPGREAGTSWVVGDGQLVERSDVAPLKITAFKAGAKVRVRGRLEIVIGSDKEAYERLEKAIVLKTRDGGFTYDVRLEEGDESGFTRTLSAASVFAR